MLGKKRYIALSAALLLVILAGIAFFALHGGQELAPPVESAPVWHVSVKDKYEDGVHGLTGTITVPDRCIVPDVAAVLADNGAVRVDLSVAEDPEPCLALPTDADWNASVEAPSTSPVEIYVNGAPVTPAP